MIYDEGCDPHEASWAEQVAEARREAAARRRHKLLTSTVGYGLVLGGLVWAWLRWLA